MKKSHRKQLYFSSLSEPSTENHTSTIEIDSMVKIKLWERYNFLLSLSSFAVWNILKNHSEILHNLFVYSPHSIQYDFSFGLLATSALNI